MNEEMMGLAGQGMQEQALPQRDEMEQMVVQVAQLIMQGATAEELLQMGVDRSIIEMAMELVRAQTAETAGNGLAGLAYE